jgi:hypothetical protein
MKKFILLSAIWILLTQATTPAPFCSCNDAGPFLTVAPSATLVSLVKVTKYLSFIDIYSEKTPMSMEVEILDTYKGKEERRSVKVWGDPGNLCRPYLSTFKKGGYYVIAFYQGAKRDEEKETDYSISICGTFWLTADPVTQLAKGNIDGKKDTIKLNEIKSQMVAKFADQHD